MPKTFLLKYIRGCNQEQDQETREPYSDFRTDQSLSQRQQREEARSYAMPPTPPSPKIKSEPARHTSDVANNLSTRHHLVDNYERIISNPLSQLAEISLSMAGRQQAGHNQLAFYPKSLLVQQAQLASLMWPSVAAAALAANYAKDLSLTPSNSPSPPMTSSPPPAHTSPVHSPVVHHLRRSSIVSSSSMTSSASSPPPAHRSSWIGSYQPRFEVETAEDLRVVARKIDFQSEPLPLLKTPSEVCSSEEEYSLSGAEIREMGRGDVHECADCGKCYSTSSNLARHRQTHRSLEDKKARKCPHCNKTYVSMPAYSMHLRTHNQGCKCNFCGKCFSRPWLLQGHIRTHTGEKPFTCDVCEKSFADKSNLRAHVQTHSNTKPFVCSRCNKAFALKSYLYKHEESSCMKLFRGKSDRRQSGKSTDNLMEAEDGEVNRRENFYDQGAAEAFLMAASSSDEIYRS